MKEKINKKEIAKIRYHLTNSNITESIILRTYNTIGIMSLEDLPKDLYQEILDRITALKRRLRAGRIRYGKEHKSDIPVRKY